MPDQAPTRPARVRPRAAYLVLALVTVAIGLAVHGGRLALGPAARDVAGDALWAAMMAWLAGLVAPRAALGRRSAAAFLLCVLVELSQLYHAPGLDALRRTPLGQLTLGSGFDARDLGAYAIGVLAAALLEWLAARGLARAAVLRSRRAR